MSNTHKTIWAICLFAIALVSFGNTANAAKALEKDKCEITSAVDTVDNMRSIRFISANFNKTDFTQACVSQWNINVPSNLISINSPLVIKGLASSSTGLTIDGNGVEIVTSKSFKGECAIIIDGSASGVTLRNINIRGDGRKVNGICVHTPNNKFENVRVGYFGGNGFVFTPHATENMVTSKSAVLYNKGLGVVVHGNGNAANRNSIGVDTILLGNNETGTDLMSVQVENVATGDKEESSLTKLIVGEKISSRESNAGQQIFVENDKSYYKISYAGTAINKGTYTVTAKIYVDVDKKMGAMSNTVFLAYKANPGNLGDGTSAAAIDLNNVKLEDNLLGYVKMDKTVLPGAAGVPQLKATFPGTGTVSFQVPKSVDVLYFRIIPTTGGVASSTTVMQVGGSSGKFFFANNSELTSQEAQTQLGSLADGSPLGNMNNSGDLSNASDGDETSLEVMQKRYETYYGYMYQNCKENHQTPGVPYADATDSDGDGIRDGLEDNQFEDCAYGDSDNVAETNQFSYDTDGDGLPDGAEDANKNGFVDCSGTDANGNKVGLILPNYKGDNVGGDGFCSAPIKKVGNQYVSTEIDCDVRPIGPGGILASYNVDGDSLGANITPPAIKVVQEDGSIKTIQPKSYFVAGAPKRIETEGYTDIVCNETDPRSSDTDKDNKDDGVELVHEYFDKTQGATLRYVASGGSISGEASCDDWLVGKYANTGRRFILTISPNCNTENLSSCPLAVECRSNGLWTTDFKFSVNTESFLGNLDGRTDPRSKDTDGDGIFDGSDKCPTDQDQKCIRQCFFGWRMHQVVKAAKISSTLSNSVRTQKIEKTLELLDGLMNDGTMASADDLKNLMPDSDVDGIPDIVEHGALPEIGDSGQNDCDVQAYNTNPFKTFTDYADMKKNKDGEVDTAFTPKDGRDLTDRVDPCPGKSDKSGDCGRKRTYSTAPVYACFVDRDNDQLMDCQEDLDLDGNYDLNTETSPLLADTDGDGVPDFIESAAGLSALSGDTDGDGIPDYVEMMRGSNVTVYEQSLGRAAGCYDESRIKASPELMKLYKLEYLSLFDTNPQEIDTDGDGISDRLEIEFGYNPVNPDSDRDGLCDGGIDVIDENTNKPLCVAGEDLNGDGVVPTFVAGDVSALDQGDIGESDPCNSNTDGDAFSDSKDKCKNVSDPSCVNPNIMGIDSDNDGLPDRVEDLLQTDRNKSDSDGDGLIDGCRRDAAGEPILGTGELCNQMRYGQFYADFRQVRSDMNCGGLKEKYYGCDTDPMESDTDKDGLNDFQERTYPTHPQKPDTDGDGLTDYQEELRWVFDSNGNAQPQVDLVDGVYTPCREVSGPNGIVGKVCPELNANDADTDGDGCFDGGALGPCVEDANSNGYQDRDASGMPLETSPLTFDTDGDWIGDRDELCRFNQCGGAANMNAAVYGAARGCTLQAASSTAPMMQWILGLLSMAPLAILRRRRHA